MENTKPLKIAILSSVAWRTPPRRYGPWEQVASNVAEEMVRLGQEVTLFATADSLTEGRLEAIVEQGYEEDPEADAKVLEYLHLSFVMEQAHRFDIIHNHFDFMPLAYTRLVPTPIITTIHGFSSPRIIPMYRRFNDVSYYVSISDSDRDPALDYLATVYNGINESQFTFREEPGGYLLYFGRIHPHKGTYEAIQIARKAKRRLLISGPIQDEVYFRERIHPLLDGSRCQYIGNSGPVERDALLGGALALLHPITFDEPFGLSVAEAMLCGTPVIAFQRGSMPELIRHGETGFLVTTVKEAAQAVELVLTLNRRSINRYALARFTRRQMGESYLRLYEQVLERHSSRPKRSPASDPKGNPAGNRPEQS